MTRITWTILLGLLLGAAPLAAQPADDAGAPRERWIRLLSGFEAPLPVEALREAGDKAFEPLVALVDDASVPPMVRRRAVLALGHVAHPALPELLKAWAHDPLREGKLRRRAVLALAQRAGAGALDDLTRVAADPDEGVREAALRALAGLGEVGRDALRARREIEPAAHLRARIDQWLASEAPGAAAPR